MSEIDTNLPTEVIAAVAFACGFSVNYDRSPDVDEWTLSNGHGLNHVTYIGTRQSICAFLTGYAAMQQQTQQMLNDLERDNQMIISGMRRRLDGASPKLT